MSLDDARRDHLGRLAVGVEQTARSPRQLALWQNFANAQIRGLREIFPELSDDNLAIVAAQTSKLYAMMTTVSLSDISEVLDNTLSSYSLAAGALAGKYTLPVPLVPERDDADASSSPEPPAAEPERPAPIGQYL